MPAATLAAASAQLAETARHRAERADKARQQMATHDRELASRRAAAAGFQKSDDYFEEIFQGRMAACVSQIDWRRMPSLSRAGYLCILRNLADKIRRRGI